MAQHCVMSFDLLTALIAFAFVTSITPGPNNLMLMASGANFGFARTIPHLLGVVIGFTLMIFLIGAGLAQLFEAYPVSYRVLKLVSIVYLFYLAWKIATASKPEGAENKGTPITFVQAVLFQWVNPKAWAMALTAITAYAPTQSVGAIVLVAIIFGLVNLPSVGSWTLLGQEMRRILTNTLRLRVFNGVMAVLLIASLVPVLFAI